MFSTYDRENLDFEQDGIKQWNQQVLLVAGSVARSLYDTLLGSETPARLVELFPFVPATPKETVGLHIQQVNSVTKC